MSWTVPEGVAWLFRILTGEEFPYDLDEAKARALSIDFLTSSTAVETLDPRLRQFLANLVMDMDGETVMALYAILAPLTRDQYLLQASEFMRELAKNLDQIGYEGEHLKLVTVLQLPALLVEMVLAYAMSSPTGGVSMLLFGARAAAIRAFLQTKIGFIVGMVLNSLIVGVGMQVLVEGLAQLIQGKFNKEYMLQAVYIGLTGVALMPFVAGLAKLVESMIIKTAMKFGLNQAQTATLRNWVSKINVLPTSGGHEMGTEGAYTGITEGEIKLNPYAFTAGMFSGVMELIGHKLSDFVDSGKQIQNDVANTLNEIADRVYEQTMAEANKYNNDIGDFDDDTVGGSDTESNYSADDFYADVDTDSDAGSDDASIFDRPFVNNLPGGGRDTLEITAGGTRGDNTAATTNNEVSGDSRDDGVSDVSESDERFTVSDVSDFDDWGSDLIDLRSNAGDNVGQTRPDVGPPQFGYGEQGSGGPGQTDQSSNGRTPVGQPRPEFQSADVAANGQGADGQGPRGQAPPGQPRPEFQSPDVATNGQGANGQGTSGQVPPGQPRPEFQSPDVATNGQGANGQGTSGQVPPGQPRPEFQSPHLATHGRGADGQDSS